MSTLFYVRAGACTQGPMLASPLANCALESTACPSGTTFWSSQQLTANLEAQAAICLQSAPTNALLEAQCQDDQGAGFTETPAMGACLVNGNIYQCALSADGCATDNAQYVDASFLFDNTDIMCELCGLQSYMDDDLSDLMPLDDTGTFTAGGGDDVGATTNATEAALPDDETILSTTNGTDAAVDGLTGPTSTAMGDSVAVTNATVTDFDEPSSFTTPTTAGFGNGGMTTPATPSNSNNTPDELGGSSDSDDGSSSSSSDTTNTGEDQSLMDEYKALNEEQKIEAAGVAGIVLGILIGCFLVCYCQYVCCKRRRRNGIDKTHLAVNPEYTDDEEEDRMI